MRVKIGSMAWLDRSALNEDQLRNLRAALTIHPRRTSSHPKARDPEPIYLYRDEEESGLFGVPREFFHQTATQDHDIEMAVTDGLPMSGFGTVMRFDGSYAEQADALDVLVSNSVARGWGGQLLQGGCGFGKTNVGLEYARRMGKRTLIIVHKTMFLRQWQQRIEDFFPGATVGRIQADECDVDHDYVIAMVHSLVNHVELLQSGKPTKYPKDVLSRFGTVIVDECHRIGASSWSEVMKYVPARHRLGLTATPRRKDGAENVFKMHIGTIAYTASTKPIVPKVISVPTDSEVKDAYTWEMLDGAYHRTKTSASSLGLSQIESQLAADGYRNRLIAEEVVAACNAGRKCIVISSRVEHLWLVRDEILSLRPDTVIDAYTGSWFVLDQNGNREMVYRSKGGKRIEEPKLKTRTEDDLELAERAQVVLATKQMVEEGLDIQALDALFLTMPMSDIEQAVGRCQRECKPSESKCSRLCSWRAGQCTGKPVPIVVDLNDENVSQLSGKWRARRSFYVSIGSIT